MIDILLLSDSSSWREGIRDCVLPGNGFHTVATSQEFREWLQEGNRARMYLLEDWVPPSTGRVREPSFMEHYKSIRQCHLDSTIAYIGPFSTDEIKALASQEKIKEWSQQRMSGTFLAFLREYFSSMPVRDTFL